MDINLIKNVSLLVGIVDFVMYATYVWGRFGVQNSISLSFYDWTKREKYLFRVFVWILCLAIIASGIGWQNPLFFVSGILLSFVGIFSNIEQARWKYICHMIGAIGGILACFVGVTMINWEIGLLVASLTLSHTALTYLLGKKENIIWNIEVACFIYLIGSLLYIINVL